MADIEHPATWTPEAFCMSVLFPPRKAKVHSLLSHDPRGSWRDRLLRTSPFSGAQQDEVLDLRGPSPESYLCPTRSSLLDELAAHLESYDAFRDVWRRAMFDQHTKTIEALMRLDRELGRLFDLPDQEKLPASSRMKGLHQKTLRKYQQELRDILWMLGPEDYQRVPFRWIRNAKSHVNRPLIQSMRNAFWMYGPQDFSKDATYYTIARILLELGIEPLKQGQTVRLSASRLAEAWRQRIRRAIP
jgi:hypothetical protein